MRTSLNLMLVLALISGLSAACSKNDGDKAPANPVSDSSPPSNQTSADAPTPEEASPIKTEGDATLIAALSTQKVQRVVFNENDTMLGTAWSDKNGSLLVPTTTGKKNNALLYKVSHGKIQSKTDLKMPALLVYPMRDLENILLLNSNWDADHFGFFKLESNDLNIYRPYSGLPSSYGDFGGATQISSLRFSSKHFSFQAKDTRFHFLTPDGRLKHLIGQGTYDDEGSYHYWKVCCPGSIVTKGWII